MLSRVAELAGKTRAFAETALEALDAHDGDEEDDERRHSVIDPDLAALGSPPQTPPPRLEDGNKRLLQELVGAVGGKSQSGSDVAEAAQVLVTQLTLVRAEAAASPALQESQKLVAMEGSLIQLVELLVDGAGSNDAATSLLEALEAEQVLHEKTRTRLNAELKKSHGATRGENVDVASVVAERDALRQQVIDVTGEKEALSIECQKTHRMLAKVVREKMQLEVERDNAEMVDARILRSVFVSLCAQIDNRSIRSNALGVMAQLLQLSPDERAAANISTSEPTTAVERKPGGLASAFMQFLEEELTPHVTAPVVPAEDRSI